MGILSITRSYDRTGERNEKFERFYTLKWEVVTDDPDDAQNTVLNAMPVSIGSVFEEGSDVDAWAECTNIKAVCTSDDGCQWDVVASFGPRSPREENPLDQPADVRIEYAQFERIMDTDADGNPVVNAAGDPFDPPVMRDDSRPILKITRNEAEWRPAFLTRFRDTVNEGLFYGYEPNCAKCQPILVVPGWHPACGRYYIHNYEFHIDEDGWNAKPLNQGMRRIKDGVRSQIMIEGLPANAPVPLAEDGTVLPTDAEPFYLNFRKYKYKDYSVLNLE